MIVLTIFRPMKLSRKILNTKIQDGPTPLLILRSHRL